MFLPVNFVLLPAVTLELFFFLKPTYTHNRAAVPQFIWNSLSVLGQLLSAFECFHWSPVIPCARNASFGVSSRTSFMVTVATDQLQQPSQAVLD